MPRRKNRAIMPFQSTLPRRERHTILLSIFPDVYFNPRSREGSDLTGSTLADTTRKISIHAPAKGATSPVASSSTSSIYFNPRSREGSDICQPYLAMFLLTFQSTLPRRERRTDCVIPSATSSISIHAPAKGATGWVYEHSGWSKHFNPRSREGSDFTIIITIYFFINFNPRSREGSDSIYKILQFFQSDFNPRSREGSDCQENYQNFAKKEFQSTLPRRERQHFPLCPSVHSHYFNPRSREGSDF